MKTVISIGYRCTTAALIKNLGLKHESYPFDWLISKLPVVKDCIQSRFEEFMNEANYVDIVSPTLNKCDDEVISRGYQFMVINRFYQGPYGSTDTNNYQLAMPHYNVNRDKDYYKRCIARFYELMESPQSKLIVYIHPLLGSKEYADNEENIINTYKDFSTFIANHFNNATCLFLNIVRGFGNSYTCIYNNNSTIIYKIEATSAVSDYGLIYFGDYYMTQSTLEYLIKLHTTT